MKIGKKILILFHKDKVQKINQKERVNTKVLKIKFTKEMIPTVTGVKKNTINLIM